MADQVPDRIPVPDWPHQIVLSRIDFFREVEYTLPDGSKSYLCGDCHQRTLTTSASTLPAKVGGFTPPSDATCSGCGGAVVGRTDAIYAIIPPLEEEDEASRG